MDKKKLDDLMSKRFNPEREAIEPVDLYGVKDTERPNAKPNERANGRTNKRTVKRTNERTDTEEPTILTELKEGSKEAVRKTQRYSFEIYTDQKNSIEELQYKYKKKTDKRVSASSIIREALDIYLDKAKKNL